MYEYTKQKGAIDRKVWAMSPTWDVTGCFERFEVFLNEIYPEPEKIFQFQKKEYEALEVQFLPS